MRDFIVDAMIPILIKYSDPVLYINGNIIYKPVCVSMHIRNSIKRQCRRLYFLSLKSCFLLVIYNSFFSPSLSQLLIQKCLVSFFYWVLLPKKAFNSQSFTVLHMDLHTHNTVCSLKLFQISPGLSPCLGIGISRLDRLCCSSAPC